METTPYTVRQYVIPMLFCVVVSTSAIKTQSDFASHKIFPTDFNSDGSDAFSVVLIQHVIYDPSISIDDPERSFTYMHQMRFVKSELKDRIKDKKESDSTCIL